MDCRVKPGNDAEMQHLYLVMPATSPAMTTEKSCRTAKPHSARQPPRGDAARGPRRHRRRAPAGRGSRTWPLAVGIGEATTSSASPVWVSVSPQAILGMTEATCSAAAQAMLDSPVLQEIFTLMPSLSHSLPASVTRADAAELDRLQADAARGLALVMAPDVVERMNAFVGADRDVGCRRHRRHAGEVVGRHRLLEEIETRALDRAHIGRWPARRYSPGWRRRKSACRCPAPCRCRACARRLSPACRCRP